MRIMHIFDHAAAQLISGARRHDHIFLVLTTPTGLQCARKWNGMDVTECLTSDIFSMLLCGVSDYIIVFTIDLAPISL